MVHLDLFSGIGGFAYAVDKVWDNVEHIFVENDPFCQKVLQKHWKFCKILGDIRTVNEGTLWSVPVANAKRTKPEAPRTTGATSVSKNTVGNITGTTNQNGLPTSKKDDGNKDSKPYKPMGENVIAVEKRSQSSLPLTTSMVEKKTNREDTQPTSTLSDRDTPIDSKFSAITATVPRGTTKSAPTRKQNDTKDVTDTERKGWWKRPKPEKGQIAGRDNRIDLLTGGFPCQPFSAAGVRRGTADERYLWPEMLRVIRLAKPTWVIAENVRGLLTWENGLVFEQICSDLEASGYEVQPFIIPAVAVNAPHRRDRIWFVAYSLNNRQGREKRKGNRQSDKVPKEHRPQDSTARQFERTNGNGQTIQHAPNPRYQRPAEQEQQTTRNKQYSWESDWLEVATELCSVDDGLSAEVGDFTLTKAGHRKEQLKAYGNAIVPQVAIEIMKGMKL